MTHPPVSFDPFHKSVVVAATEGLGRSETQHAIERGVYFADVWFEPAPPPVTPRPELGFWNVMAETAALIELFRCTPGPIHLTDIVAKTLTKERSLRHRPDRLAAMRTWVITPGRPRAALAGWGAQGHTSKGWPSRGLYRLACTVPTFVVVCRELPIAPDTLVLRLLGRGETLHTALLELAALNAPWTVTFKELLIERHIMVAQPQYPRDGHDQDFVQQFATVAKQFVHDLREEGREEGRDEGREEGREEGALRPLARLLQLRLGRPLADAERDALKARLHTHDPEALTERIFTEAPDPLLAWLLAPEADGAAPDPS